MSLNEYIDNFFKNKLEVDSSYTYEKAKEEVEDKLIEINNKKILRFNRNIEYQYDNNNMPKIIHLTLKNKFNIDNSIWREAINRYIKMYPDYKIMVYDNNDIYRIIHHFDNKNMNVIMNINKGAVLADIFRYLILYLRGGYYSDMDCFPIKRIDKLSEIQYHGDNNNNINIYPLNMKLMNRECDFYRNPCNHCTMIHNNNNSLIKFKCQGHKYIKKNTDIILCYEFEKTWHTKITKSNEKQLWCDNDIGICQWFIGTKPNEKLFLSCYKKSVKNISSINLNDGNYHFNVINSTGPLFFTKVINKYINKYTDFSNKLSILPSDFFCCGSGFYGEVVPHTKNKFIEHKFTGTWLK
jgi:mannosyltransferase OCH1-like enzyme